LATTTQGSLGKCSRPSTVKWIPAMRKVVRATAPATWRRRRKLGRNELITNAASPRITNVIAQYTVYENFVMGRTFKTMPSVMQLSLC
jgi:hypothetical protein